MNYSLLYQNWLVEGVIIALISGLLIWFFREKIWNILRKFFRISSKLTRPTVNVTSELSISRIDTISKNLIFTATVRKDSKPWVYTKINIKTDCSHVKVTKSISKLTLKDSYDEIDVCSMPFNYESSIEENSKIYVTMKASNPDFNVKAVNSELNLHESINDLKIMVLKEIKKRLNRLNLAIFYGSLSWEEVREMLTKEGLEVAENIFVFYSKLEDIEEREEHERLNQYRNW